MYFFEFLYLTREKTDLINSIFEKFFSAVKFYSLRVEFSFEEYRNRTIEWNLQRLRRYIWTTLRSWLVILYIGAMSFWPNCPIPGIHYLLGRFPVDRHDLMFGYYIIMILWVETLSLVLLRSLICYDMRLNDALQNLIQSKPEANEMLSEKILNNFFRKYLLLSFVFNLIFRGVYCFVSGIYILVLIDLFQKLYSQQLTPIEVVSVAVMGHHLYRESIFFCGKLFNELFGFAFTGNFYLRKFINLVHLFGKVLKRKKSQQRNRMIQQYSQEYLHQSFEISLVNHSTRKVFFIIEMMSKCSIVFILLFYNNQTQMNLYSDLLLFMVSLFCLVSATLMAKVSSFECWNNLLFRSIISWQIRNQFSLQRKSPIYHQIYGQASLLNDIRMNYFIQNISLNRIGFTCGQIFNLTKFKFIELQLMNCILVFLFYKRFLL